MGKTVLGILKNLSIILLLTIPPWIVFRGYIKDKIKRVWLILIFIAYMVLTYFTENLVPFVLVMVILFFNKKREEDNEESYYLRPLGKNKFEALISSLIFWGIFFLANLTYNLIKFKITKALPKPQEVINIFLNKGWGVAIILAIMAVIFAPILEEFIFRHILYRNISKKTGKIWAAILSTILFTVLHYSPAQAIGIFAVGAYNCYLYEKYGYRAAVINHFILNFVSTMMVLGLKALS